MWLSRRVFLSLIPNTQEKKSNNHMSAWNVGLSLIPIFLSFNFDIWNMKWLFIFSLNLKNNQYMWMACKYKAMTIVLTLKKQSETQTTSLWVTFVIISIWTFSEIFPFPEHYLFPFKLTLLTFPCSYEWNALQYVFLYAILPLWKHCLCREVLVLLIFWVRNSLIWRLSYAFRIFSNNQGISSIQKMPVAPSPK